MILKVDFIKFRPEGRPVRARFDLALIPGSLTFLTGPKESGKATVLQAIQGGLRPDAGRISLGPRIWFHGDGQKCLETLDRSVSLISGELDLLRRKTVGWHISSVLGHWSTRSRGKRVTELLKRVGLEESNKLLVSELNPEQRWRLALARALAPQPCLLLLEEPFNGLRLPEQKRLVRTLRDLLQEEGVPALLSLQDTAEIARLGERILEVETLPLRRPAASRLSVSRASAVA